MPIKLESDKHVNQSVPDLPYEVNNPDDLHALRLAWTELPRIPKLIDGALAAIILESGGQLIRSLVKGEESAGALSVCYVVLQPGNPGAPDHHQPFEDELWFALQGDWEWTIGDETKRVGPGAFGYAPRNTRHSFRNVGNTAAIMFTLNTPAGHERGFQGVHKLMAEKAPMELVGEHFAKHDFVFHDKL